MSSYLISNTLSGEAPALITQHNPSISHKTDHIAIKIIKAIGQFFYDKIHRAIGFLVVPAQLMSKDVAQNKISLIRDLGGIGVSFKTADNVSLNGMYFEGKDCQPSSRTVIFFNGNGVRYEEYGGVSLSFDLSSWQKRGWNVVVFNYRGVGESAGRATRDGLILDGVAVLKGVREELKVPDHKILLHGHSLGGGIASEVAAKNPQVNYCNDRSFISLSKQVEVMLGRGILGSLAKSVLTYFGWEFNAQDNWEKMQGKKFATYHQNDGVIPEGARFYESLGPSDHTIHLKSTTVKFGSTLLPDSPDLIKGKVLQDSSRVKWLTKLTGQLAHGRGFSASEQEQYFRFIDDI